MGGKGSHRSSQRPWGSAELKQEQGAGAKPLSHSLEKGAGQPWEDRRGIRCEVVPWPRAEAAGSSRHPPSRGCTQRLVAGGQLNRTAVTSQQHRSPEGQKQAKGLPPTSRQLRGCGQSWSEMEGRPPACPSSSLGSPTACAFSRRLGDGGHPLQGPQSQPGRRTPRACPPPAAQAPWQGSGLQGPGRADPRGSPRTPHLPCARLHPRLPSTVPAHPAQPAHGRLLHQSVHTTRPGRGQPRGEEQSCWQPSRRAEAAAGPGRRAGGCR